MKTKIERPTESEIQNPNDYFRCGGKCLACDKIISMGKGVTRRDFFLSEKIERNHYEMHGKIWNEIYYYREITPFPNKYSVVTLRR